MSSKEELVLLFQKFRARGLTFIPARYRRKVKEALLGGKVAYKLADGIQGKR
jgi:hypothetical protein